MLKKSSGTTAKNKIIDRTADAVITSKKEKEHYDALFDPIFTLFPDLLGIHRASPGVILGYIIFLYDIFATTPPIWFRQAGIIVLVAAAYFSNKIWVRVPAAALLHAYTAYLFGWGTEILAVVLAGACKYVCDPLRYLYFKAKHKAEA